MKTSLLVVVAVFLNASVSFAEDLAFCEKPHSGDPNYKAYIYVDGDGEVKTDIYRGYENLEKIALKVKCESTSSLSISTAEPYDVPLGDVSLECISADFRTVVYLTTVKTAKGLAKRVKIYSPWRYDFSHPEKTLFQSISNVSCK